MMGVTTEARVIIVYVYFTDGTQLMDSLDVERAGEVQGLMDWFRTAKAPDTWTMIVGETRDICVFRHDQVKSLEIRGYIEPGGRRSRWHERLGDKARALLYGKRWLK